MRKSLTAAILIFLMAVSAFFLLCRSTGKLLNSPAGSPPQTAFSAAKNTPDSEEASISGQVIYDARTALPPQAMLEVKLTETDRKTHINNIITETRRQPDGTSPIDWKLPIKLGALDKAKSYKIQAKISSGDTLLFVNAVPTALDISRAAYIIRLAKIDDGSSGKPETRSLIGLEWRAAVLGNKMIEPNSEISLTVNNEEKTDPAGGDKFYQAGGSTGCNRYQTAAILNENKKSLKFSPIASGFIACAAVIAHQEADFIAMMSEVRSYKIDESGALLLLDAGQNTLARFTARPQ